MKAHLVTLLIGLGTLGGIASGLAQTITPSPPAVIGQPTTSGARIQFAETTFDFGKVNGGEVVRHDFVFTNTGSTTLEINNVLPGCGCTTAGAWDKMVQPGKNGVVPLQFNSTGFSGTVTKSATVTCNDPGQSNVLLHLKSTVWNPIDITPSMAMFNLPSETQSNETRVVRIVSNLEEPIELSDLQCTNRAFQAELKTVRPGKEFALHITAVPPFPSTPINARVTLKTSSTKMPTINVSAYVMLQPPVTVIPNQIILPAGPLTNAMQRVVTIRNTGSNSLVLSQPHVSVPGPEAHVKETQPGRSFDLTVDFPAGFQVQPGQNVEVTTKSSHPKFPIIKVSVFQLPPAVGASTQSVSSGAPALPAKPAAPTTLGK
jgi:hypothetical protein